MKYAFKIALLAVCLCAWHIADAQTNNSSGGKDTSELAQLIVDIESNFSDIRRHVKLVRFLKPESQELAAQYEKWMKKYPGDSNIPYYLGEVLTRGEYPNAKEWLEKALAMDPKHAAAWAALSADAERWGDFQGKQNYMKKAVEFAPEVELYTFRYGLMLLDYHEKDADRFIEEAVRRFPLSQMAPQVLFFQAENAEGVKEKTVIYERILREYAPGKYRWSDGAMWKYFDMLIDNALFERADQLASNMLNMKMESSYINWPDNKNIASSLLQFERLSDERKYDQALGILNKVDEVRRSLPLKNQLILAKAKALYLSGNTKAAYDSLMTFYNKTPSLKALHALSEYGKAIGKNETVITQELRMRMNNNAKLATEFTLRRYGKIDSSRLSDYRGKVVLLTYWFPGCGPCRVEFPHFENVLKKFDRSEVEYLGINIVRSQDEFVLPFLKGSGYTFTALADESNRDYGNLKFVGAPTNFLIDKEGKIVYSHFMIGKENEDMLELMIKSLL